MESILLPHSLTVKAENAVGSVLVTLSFEVLLRPSIQYTQDQYVIAVNASFVSLPIVAGDAVSFVLSSGQLPQGLSLNADNGIIHGTPVASSESVVIIEAVNSIGRASATVAFRVLVPLSVYSYPQTYYQLVKGTTFSVLPTVYGDSPVYSVAAGLLPSGLSLNNRTGEISGVPNSLSSMVSVILQAQNEVGSLQASLVFEVILMSPIVTTLLSVLGVVIVIALFILFCCFCQSRKKQRAIDHPSSVEKDTQKPLDRGIELTNIHPSGTLRRGVVNKSRETSRETGRQSTTIDDTSDRRESRVAVPIEEEPDNGCPRESSEVIPLNYSTNTDQSETQSVYCNGLCIVSSYRPFCYKESGDC